MWCYNYEWPPQQDFSLIRSFSGWKLNIANVAASPAFLTCQSSRRGNIPNITALAEGFLKSSVCSWAYTRQTGCSLCQNVINVYVDLLVIWFHFQGYRAVANAFIIESKQRNLHLSWTLQKSAETCVKCGSLRWSSCGAGRSAAEGRAPGHAPNRQLPQSLRTSRCERSSCSRWSLRRPVQTPCRSAAPSLYSRPLTRSELRGPFFVWGHPRPTARGTKGMCTKARTHLQCADQANDAWYQISASDPCSRSNSHNSTHNFFRK